jgi:poly-beta-1,6-N-acetyl-D-glucosamine biosynthesis protein PgaD
MSRRSTTTSDEPRSQLALEVALTAIFWGLWLYVIAPLVSILLWLAGVQVFVEQMITLGGYEHLLGKLTTYGLVILGIVFTTFAWVVWNIRRYGRRNTRRRAPPLVTLKETASAAGMRPDAIRRLQRQRRLVIDFDDQDRLVPQETMDRSFDLKQVK